MCDAFRFVRFGFWGVARSLSIAEVKSMPPRGVPPEHPPRGFPEGFLGGILSYLDSPSLKVALQDVESMFFMFFMLSSTLPSLNVALREVGFTFFC